MCHRLAGVVLVLVACGARLFARVPERCDRAHALWRVHGDLMAASTIYGLQDTWLELDIRTNAQGQKVLHFDFMDISDLHLGTRHSRAKKTSHMMQHTEADIFRLGGDEVDGTYMRRKKTWHFAPWHRQMLGHILRKVEQGSKVTKVT